MAERSEEAERHGPLVDRLDAVIARRALALATLERLRVAMFAERFGHPLPEHNRDLDAATLGKAIAKLEPGWSPRCATRPARAGEWGVIKVSAVSSGWFRAEENKALPPSIVPRERLGLRAGDVLMVRSNTRTLVGTTARVPHDHPRLLLSDKVWRLRPTGDGAFDQDFVRALLSHPAVRRRLSAIASGNLASMQNLTQANVLALPIVRPPIAAQREFATDLQLVDGVECAQREHAALLERLRGALGGSVLQRPRRRAGAGGTAIGRALFGELSPSQQAIWRALVEAEGALTMTQLSRRLAAGNRVTPEVDRLRRALELLTAAGVAVCTQDSRGLRWSQAVPHDWREAS